MTIKVNHSYVSANGDPSDTTIIGQTKWNADHSITATDTDGSMVFASGGVLAASSNISWNDATKTLSIVNAPTADQNLANALFSDNGVLSFSQNPGAWLATAMQRYITWYPGTGTTQPSMIGSAVATTTGTWSNIGGSSTDITSRQNRASCTTAASAGATAVYSPTGGRIFSGAGLLGSYTEMLCGIGVNTTGHQCFFGLSSSVSALAGDPSALTNIVGIGFDAADSSAGNWQFYTNDGTGTATKLDTGIPRAINQALWIKMYNVPNSSTWVFIAKDINAGGIYINSNFSVDTPVSTVALAPVHLIRTGALTSAISMFLIGGFCKWIVS